VIERLSVDTPRRVIVFSRGVYVVLGFVALGYLVWLLRDVLTPIFLAVTIAYILDPVVDRLERWKLPRPLGVAVVLLVAIGAVALFLLLVLPDVISDVAAVVRELPSKAQALLAKTEPWLLERGIRVPHTADEWVSKLQGHANTAASSLLAPAGNVLKWAIGGTMSVIGAVIAALIVPILAIYLLNDFDRMTAGIRELIPNRYKDTVLSYAREIDVMLSQFMRGQLTVMAILAVLYGGAYSLLGVRLAIPIGIAAGILNFIPYLGSAFALVAGLLMTLIGGGGLTQMIGVVVAYAVVQTLEGFVITPRIVGESVGLREVWVLLALFVGGEIFGFLGVLLAVPVAAVLKIFVGRAIAHYKESGLFLTPAESMGVLATEAVSLPIDGADPPSPPPMAPAANEPPIELAEDAESPEPPEEPADTEEREK
jgi:predicted PurR-regulated permease PerM